MWGTAERCSKNGQQIQAASISSVNNAHYSFVGEGRGCVPGFFEVQPVALLRPVSRPGDPPPPSLASFLRAFGKQAPSAEDAIYILQAIGVQVSAPQASRLRDHEDAHPWACARAAPLGQRAHRTLAP